MSTLLLYWLILAITILVLIVGRGNKAGPLVLGYFASLSIIYVPGILSYTGAAAGTPNEGLAESGFKLVLLGLCAYIFGAFLGQNLSLKKKQKEALIALDDRVQSQFGLLLLGIGVMAYFFAIPILSFIPSVTSLASAAGLLILVGYWYYFFYAFKFRNARRILLGLASIPLLPLSTMITGGFLGFGTFWLIAIGCFAYVLSKQKALILAALPFLVYAGLSFGVAYFADRTVLRENVWQEKANIGGGFNTVVGMISNLEPLDINRKDHVAMLLERLNESVLVGTGVENYSDGFVDLVYGATVPVWALIPRAIWPNKPVVGGGGELVSEFTGVYFSENTSVGIGQTLEFFMNFGLSGVLVGFFFWGFVLAKFDHLMRTGFENGRLGPILVGGLCGASMLQPNGNLLEILVTTVASFVVAQITLEALKRFGALDHDGRPIAVKRKKPALQNLPARRYR
jgi:hypothetical protein